MAVKAMISLLFLPPGGQQGLMSREMQLSEASKGKDRPSPSLQEPALPHLDLGPVKLISDVWLPGCEEEIYVALEH